MIVSASYRTDIPAYFGGWFMKRLAAGYCMVVNPYGGRPYRVPLRREDGTQAVVFWTRDLSPFIEDLEIVARAHGLPFVVQQTVTAYPAALEGTPTDVGTAVANMRRLGREYGPRAAVWRYDPVIFSSLTPPEWHLERFAETAAALSGSIDEVVVSFAQVYRKTRRNLDAAALKHRFTWEDPPDTAKRELLGKFALLAAGHGMRLSICAQPGLRAPGVHPASCINPHRLTDVARHLGIDVEVTARRRPHREDCGCYESRDIGAYHTCPRGCAYCYAVDDAAAALRRLASHDPSSEFLFAPGRPGEGPAWRSVRVPPVTPGRYA